MKRKLIIHVGMGKTGSSSIQKTLRVARATLEKEGVIYLGLMLEQLNLPLNYGWRKVDGWKDYLQMESHQANRELAHVLQYADDNLPESVNTLIWSNESLFDSFSKVTPALEALKDRYVIQVVGYIRRPDSWITSAYLQWGIKHKTYKGPLKSFEKWSSQMRYIVMPMIDAWEKIDARAQFFNFDTIENIAEHFQSNFLPGSLSGIQVLNTYETPPPNAMAMFAFYNSLSEDQVLPSELEPLLIQSSIMKKMQGMPDYNNLLPDENAISTYLSANKDEIDRVNQYFSEKNVEGFDLSSLVVKDYSTTQKDINRTLLKMIVSLSKQVGELNNKLTNLEARND